MSNLLTVSRMKTWRECRRKHALMYLEGWRPAKAGDPLRQGSIGHLGLEAWWKDDGSDRLGAAFAAMAGRADDPYEQAAMEELLRGYHDRWVDDMDRYVVHAVEESFVVPLPNPETGAVSRTWLLAGKLDGVLRDTRTSELLILEHKLTSETFASDADPYWIKLGMDAQVSQYYVGGEGLGYPAEGCLYDVLRRPQLKPLQATPEESRKYTKAGVLYANQRDRDETPEEYRLRVRADISDHPDKYFRRRTVARTHQDVIEYLADVWDEGRMIREAELAGRSPRNPESCHRFGQCPFWAACAYGVRPEDHPDAFVRVDNVHPELELQEEVA